MASAAGAQATTARLNDIDEDLILCSVCLEDVDQPKALPCLHTYCLECLKKVAEKDGGRVVTCPLCKATTPVPKEGVSGFKTNFLISKFKERKAIYEKLNKSKIPCTNCEESDAEAVSRCLECRDFLCQKCLQRHKEMRILRDHPVCTLDEARSGKVDIYSQPPSSQEQMRETCDTHKGQVLWFFCKTCWVPICRDCTVVKHIRPEHEYDALEDVSLDHKRHIQKLVEACQTVSQRVSNDIEKTTKIQSELDESAKVAIEQIETAAERSLEYFKMQLQVKSRKPKEEISRWQRNRSKEIWSRKEILQCQQAGLRTALEFANQVTVMGSMYDIAHMYSDLTNTLTQLLELEQTSLNSSVSKIKFTPSENCKTMATNLGSVSLGLKAGCWVLEKQAVGADPGPGKLNSPNDVAIGSGGCMVVADTKASVKLFDVKGDFQLNLNTFRASQPHNVVIARPSGNIFVTDMTESVEVYGMKGKQLYRFPSIAPSSANNNETKLDAPVEASVAGIAVNSHGEVLVGEVNQMYISKHQQNGDHIATVEVSIEPLYIAAACYTAKDNTQKESIVISSSKQQKVVMVDAATGQVCHNLSRPAGVDHVNWKPTGVCYRDGTIFVSNDAQGEDVDLRGFFSNGGFAVYCYSESGEYLKAVTTQVVHPKGLALMEDDEGLLVADEEGVKVFHLK